MTDEVWARHTNPLSVWTRYICLPLLVLALWSRVWIGVYAILPVALVVFWTWINPRLFARPKSTDNWASKAVIGERIWLSHPPDQIPAHHHRAIFLLNLISAAGFLMALAGLYALHIWLTLAGTLITILGKSWFLDRMVWLQQDLGQAKEIYRSWNY